MKNVVLFGISEELAVFSVIEDGSIDLWDMQKHPFSCIGQGQLATGLILLPIEEVSTLANYVGDPKRPFGFIFTTGRSGSTLISQILAKVPGINVASQPWSLFQTVVLDHSGKLPSKVQKASLLQSLVRLIVFDLERRNPGGEFNMIKLASFECALMKDIELKFPNAKNIFSCRSPEPCIKSKVARLKEDCQHYNVFKYPVVHYTITK